MNKYLYCIIKGEVPKNKFQIKGMEEKGVQIINQGKFSCAISDTSQYRYPLWREHILSHQRPLEEFMKHYDVLPFSFSNIADSEEKIKQKVLKDMGEELEGLFEVFKGKIELGLKAVWSDMPLVFQEIAKNSPELQRLKKIPKLGYQQQIAAGELVKKMLNDKKEKTKEKILKSFEPLTDDFKELQLMGDDMILNAAFLTKKKCEKDFYKKVAELVQEFPNIRFRHSGPFPLYNFVSLKFNI